MREKLKENKVLNIITKILKIISWAILIMLIILAMFLIYYVLMAKKAEKAGTEYKPPIALYTIISPSMVPNINVYDVVFNVKVDDYSKLEKGDIITFVSSDSYMKGMIITHRIVEKHATNDGYQFKTKGDANVEADSALVEEDNIIGKVLFKIPQLGRVQFFLSSKGGWFIAILIPALAVISYDIFKLIRLLVLKKKLNKQSDDNNNSGNNITNENGEKVLDLTGMQNNTDNKKEEISKTIDPPTNTINTLNQNSELNNNSGNIASDNLDLKQSNIPKVEKYNDLNDQKEFTFNNIVPNVNDNTTNNITPNVEEKNNDVNSAYSNREEIVSNNILNKEKDPSNEDLKPFITNTSISSNLNEENKNVSTFGNIENNNNLKEDRAPVELQNKTNLIKEYDNAKNNESYKESVTTHEDNLSNLFRNIENVENSNDNIKQDIPKQSEDNKEKVINIFENNNVMKDNLNNSVNIKSSNPILNTKEENSDLNIDKNNKVEEKKNVKIIHNIFDGTDIEIPIDDENK